MPITLEQVIKDTEQALLQGDVFLVMVQTMHGMKRFI